MATFRCDPSLRIAAIDGAIAELLECTDRDLLEHMWHPFLDRRDRPVIEQMGAALSKGCAGRYDVCAISRSRTRLYLTIATVVEVGRAGNARGSISLLGRESPRRHIDLGSGWQAKLR